ncbi:hypothetical protein G7048_07630 [Diaphorobacter sp. HDW4B]|uniref:beta-galactosidase n=1 Tax=Diaphorobacter sp. HDW4B TaxID=2714925 RepID=UPI001407F3FA|nr:beta-galactosidase [Diaphorobacter sp. HDW4B]QIL70234.1 hypothetical protein G7048_07630 [Diaphorobacter sp. HDW4B]
MAAKDLLDKLEPGGADGKVQLGYTLLVPLLELFEQRDGRWELSPAKAKRYLDVITAIKRPVVVYLMGDHYDSSSPLSKELAQDPRNLLAYATGPVPPTRYYSHGVIPFTLRTDESIPVNRYRFDALRHMTRQISALDESVRSRIVAVTLAGELHQLYPDFENGVGEYENIQVTDYSPESQNEFRVWLQKKYGTLDRLNQKLGFQFSSVSDITAPSLDIRKTPLQSFSQHYDAFAGGTLPIFGWIWDPKQKIQQLSLYIDGKFHSQITRGLGRMDVYRAKEEVTSPNTGFRSNVQFRDMPAGKHVAQIIATSAQKDYLLGEREFVIVPRDQSSTANVPPPKRREGLPEANQLEQLQYWLDMPKPLQDVYYNPLAREWNEFRATQVNGMLNHFYRIARTEGIPARLLFSHQIVPESNGTWNPVLFASDASVSNVTPWRNGINQYGHSPFAFEYLKNKHIRDYGVPEFNPLMGKTPQLARQTFVQHYQAGARFVSPFYLSVVPARLRAPDDKRHFDIAPDNTRDGANALYSALEWFVRK